MKNSIINNDCLEVMKDIKDKSINMILSDLPYGITSRNSWDSIIPIEKLWEQYNRIIKENGAVVLTSVQPFTSFLVMSNPKQFKYEWIWEKQQGTGFLNAKKQPLRNHESILVFYNKQPTYNPQFTEGTPYSCTSGVGTSNYREQKKVTTINNGLRYPKTVLKFKYDKEKLHPTQKPLKLFEYLIKTYTNEHDIVLDNCSGSCTTALACLNTNRDYICIEKEKEFCEIGLKRINELSICNN